MKKVVTISYVDLHILNTVRAIRKEMSLTQRDISEAINPLTDNNILGQIESQFNKEKYTDEQLNKIANFFTTKAKDLGIEKIYTIKDFYPKNPVEEKMVDKIII